MPFAREVAGAASFEDGVDTQAMAIASQGTCISRESARAAWQAIDVARLLVPVAREGGEAASEQVAVAKGAMVIARRGTCIA